MDKTALLKVENLRVRYSGHEIIKGISFDLKENEWLMIAGPNGAGKSTILRAISGAVPYEGLITYKGADISRLKPVRMARIFGFLEQNHTAGYDFTVNEIVSLGRYAYKSRWLKDEDAQGAEFIEKALEITGLTGLRSKSIAKLSGGELQRAFLAQIFAQDPDVMILDEPANHLDIVYQKQILELINAWLKENEKALICVMHDLSLAKAFGTKCLLIKDGQVISSGSPCEVLSKENLKYSYDMDVYSWMQDISKLWS